MGDVSKRLLNAIKQSKMSYDEISRSCGIPKSTIQRYAMREDDRIPLPRLQLICKAVNVDVADIMGWKHKDRLYVSNDEEKLILAYRYASPEIKAAVRAVLDAREETR